jgi:hypothetical protein
MTLWAKGLEQQQCFRAESAGARPGAFLDCCVGLQEGPCMLYIPVQQVGRLLCKKDLLLQLHHGV